MIPLTIVDGLAVSHLTHISNNDDYKGYGLKPGEIFDPNPDRYFKYAKFSGETAKPSTMVNSIVTGKLYLYI